MDSRVLVREIRREIWPLLRERGFAEFTGKTAWWRLPEQIHVVNFQSFSSYLAQGVGCTTFSFALNLGIYFPAIPVHHRVKGTDPATRPEEYHCHLRRHLRKGFTQPEGPRDDIWYVAPDGSNLAEAVAAARETLRGEGLAWFEQYRSLETVLEMLLGEETADITSPPRSPLRKYMTGHIARALGRDKLAGPMIAESERELAAILGEHFVSGRSE